MLAIVLVAMVLAQELEEPLRGLLQRGALGVVLELDGCVAGVAVGHHSSIGIAAGWFAKCRWRAPGKLSQSLPRKVIGRDRIDWPFMAGKLMTMSASS
jgi:hypothetical protein